MSTIANTPNVLEDQHILYYNDYSVCSLMVRASIALCNGYTDKCLNIDEQPVNIHLGDQNSEYFLCEVNPKGTVPVLTLPNNIRGRNITDSIDITAYFGKYYPCLYPMEFSNEIGSLLGELHAINFFSLTYTHKPQRASDMENAVEKRLSDPNISARYRKALQFKRDIIHNTRTPALTVSVIKDEESKATSFLSKLTELLEHTSNGSSNTSQWIFGSLEPTALDAHTIPFLARLFDVGREDMVSERLKTYACRAFKTKAWIDMMGGRKTVFSAYL
ncbi:hypothetical protein OIDMADRAFT_182909 [Oidiodendron maius Zn]|uniref:GST N-terminal domain-containing protein n=1 Tax=Oidiodendron maius (strain Zn) TaxID=913774 RepID=A0A0C3D459_OIDMZ|nr:hypothetical protein OIDMADRAFT_182909 [Oidiodendron maius Zn]